MNRHNAILILAKELLFWLLANRLTQVVHMAKVTACLLKYAPALLAMLAGSLGRNFDYGSCPYAAPLALDCHLLLDCPFPCPWDALCLDA